MLLAILILNVIGIMVVLAFGVVILRQFKKVTDAFDLIGRRFMMLETSIQSFIDNDVTGVAHAVVELDDCDLEVDDKHVHVVQAKNIPDCFSPITSSEVDALRGARD